MLSLSMFFSSLGQVQNSVSFFRSQLRVQKLLFFEFKFKFDKKIEFCVLTLEFANPGPGTVILIAFRPKILALLAILHSNFNGLKFNLCYCGSKSNQKYKQIIYYDFDSKAG